MTTAATPGPRSRRRFALIALVVIVVVAVIAAVVSISLQSQGEEIAAPVASESPAPEPSASPEPAELYPDNTETYDLAALPPVDVFTLAPGLPVDATPGEEALGMLATPHAPGAPLFNDPLTPPIGQLPAQLRFDGTTVPVIEMHPHWVKVMISGRAGLPSEGVTGQLTAWMRASDVDVANTSMSVRVSLSTSSIAILDGEEVVYETGEFAVGAPATPTPVGRTFIMTTRVDPAAGYTRGHPIVYLGVQSTTLDGFNGQNNAVTAFHYHDARQGPISNGCLRVDAAAITQLAALPLGTPVTIYE